MKSCGLPPRSQYPIAGLPFNASDEPQNDWIVPYLWDATQWFMNAVKKPYVDNLDEFIVLMRAVAFEFMPKKQLLYARSQILKSQPAAFAALVPGRIYPQDFVRLFILGQWEPHIAFCPPDEEIFRAGMSFPGCTCMAIPSTYQSDSELVFGEARSWVDALKAAKVNASAAVADCPEGFRCSSHNYQFMRHLMSRPSLPPTLGVCVPCLVGEYCPPGTTEKTQVIMEYCSKRSAIYSAVQKQDNKAGQVQAGVNETLEATNGTTKADDDDLCFNTKLCPAGFSCPEPFIKEPCPPGFFCTEGTTSKLEAMSLPNSKSATAQPRMCERRRNPACRAMCRLGPVRALQLACILCLYLLS